MSVGECRVLGPDEASLFGVAGREVSAADVVLGSRCVKRFFEMSANLLLRAVLVMRSDC